MTCWEPELEFRATRDYLHSTDLYEALLCGCAETVGSGPDGKVSLVIRRRLHRQPRFVFADRAARRSHDAVADFSVEAGDTTHHGWIEATDRPVIARKAYDERPIWEAASVQGDRVELVRGVRAAPIEAVTALGVLLHRAVAPPGAGERWMLGRLDLERPLRDADLDGLAIAIVQRAGSRITRSTITSGRYPIGTMAFVLAGPARPTI